MIDIMSQPMGTFNSLLFDETGKPVPNAMDLMRSNLLMFDGGFGTLDKFLIVANQIETKDTDASLGMRRVFSETRSLIENDLGVTVSIPAMQNILKSGVVEVNDIMTLDTKTYPIDGYLEKANQMVAAEALDSIKDYIFKIKYLVMTGGTGDAWYEIFKTKLAKTKVTVLLGKQNSNLPTIYSNARGYYYNRLKKLGFRG